jgi:hypothetical protein
MHPLERDEVSGQPVSGAKHHPHTAFPQLIEQPIAVPQNLGILSLHRDSPKQPDALHSSCGQPAIPLPTPRIDIRAYSAPEMH